VKLLLLSGSNSVLHKIGLSLPYRDEFAFV
jgi:hypothetical protein